MTNIVLTAIVTAYTFTGHLTADGHAPQVGYCAAPRWIPFGLRVTIDGKQYEVHDRMNLRFPDRWDIFMTNRDDCLKWGNKTCRVELK